MQGRWVVRFWVICMETVGWHSDLLLFNRPLNPRPPPAADHLLLLGSLGHHEILGLSGHAPTPPSV